MRRRLVPVIAIILAFSSGCDDDAATAPTAAVTPRSTSATATTPPTTSKAPPPTVAPPVTTPVDLRRQHAHPCAALTSAQQAQVGFHTYTPGGHEGVNSESGNCRWAEKPTKATHRGYGYSLMISVSGDPLAKAYTQGTKPEASWSSFEPRQVNGLPAVVRTIISPEVDCNVVVGTGNGQGIEINGTAIPDDPTLCDRFVTAAGWIIDAARR